MLPVSAAVVQTASDMFRMEDLLIDDPRADEVLVRIMAAGVCQTDVHAQRGHGNIRFPAVFGHEGAGIVHAIGSAVTNVKVGDRVTMSFLSCGRCKNCQHDTPSYCAELRNLNMIGCRSDGSRALHALSHPDDGEKDVSSHYFGQSSFATMALAHQRNVIPIGEIPFEIAAPLGCGIQTGVGTVTRALKCPAKSSVVILGGGAVGASALLGAVINECDPIIVIDPLAPRRDLALQLGAHHAAKPPSDGKLSDFIRTVVPDGVDFVIDTTGSKATIEEALKALAIRGTLALVGIPAPGSSMAVNPGVMLSQGQTIKGIVEGDSDPQDFIPELIHLWRKGCLPIEKLIKSYHLEEINLAIQDQSDGVCIKAVLIPDHIINREKYRH